MGPLINLLVLAVFVLIGFAQTGGISKALGYGVGIPLAIVAFLLAMLRYKQRKDRE